MWRNKYDLYRMNRKRRDQLVCLSCDSGIYACHVNNETVQHNSRCSDCEHEGKKTCYMMRGKITTVRGVCKRCEAKGRGQI